MSEATDRDRQEALDIVRCGVPAVMVDLIAAALAARGGVRVVRELAKAPKGSACWSVCSVDGRGVDLQPGQSLAIIEPAPTPQPVQQAEPKQSVQNFQWDGSTPRMDGTMVWFRSIDGSEHGWPQLTDHEAMRLVLFLHGSKQRSTPPPVAGDEAYKREAMAWRRYMQHARDHELIVFRVRSQHASESECAVFQTFTALELKLYEAQDAVDAAASSAKSAAGRGEDEDAGR